MHQLESTEQLGGEVRYLFTAQDEAQMDAEILMNTDNSIRSAVVGLTNSIHRLTNNRKMQDIVSRKFRGRIRYYNNKISIMSEVLFDGREWTFQIYSTEEGKDPILEESKVGTTKGFSCDDLCCIISAFTQAYSNRNATLKRRPFVKMN